MRNLKRALSLALASVMLVGMMVVGTSAASYPDVDSNDNVEAISVLQAVGVMQGDADTGEFRPDDQVSRNEMAVIMARLLLGSDADSYVGNHPFTDVPAWADQYVAACYNEGIIKGMDDTTYGGKDTITAQQAAAMMLRALGYEKLENSGADWARNVVSKANEIRLFKSVGSNPNAALTRNQVAQLSLNTLKATMVTTESGTNINLGDLGSVTTDVKYTERTTDEFDYTQSNGQYLDGTSKDTLQLCEYLYEDKLTLDEDDEDDMGRPATSWTYDGGDPIGKVAKSADYTIVVDKAGEETDYWANEAKKNMNTNSADVVSVNGGTADSSSDIGDLNIGDVVEFYGVTDNVAGTVIVTRYSVGKIDEIKDCNPNVKKDKDAMEDDGASVVVTVKYGSTFSSSKKFYDTDITGYGSDYVEGAYIAYVEKSSKIVDSYVAETVDGKVTAKDTKNDAVTADGEKYTTSVLSSLDLGSEYTLVLDKNGIVIGCEEIAAADVDLSEVLFIVKEYETDETKYGETIRTQWVQTVSMDGVAKDYALYTFDPDKGGANNNTSPAADADIEDGTFIADAKIAEGCFITVEENDDTKDLWDASEASTKINDDYTIESGAVVSSRTDAIEKDDTKLPNTSIRVNDSTKYIVAEKDGSSLKAYVVTGGIEHTLVSTDNMYAITETVKGTKVALYVVLDTDAYNDETSSKDVVYVDAGADFTEIQVDGKSGYYEFDVYGPDGEAMTVICESNPTTVAAGFATYTTKEKGGETIYSFKRDAADKLDAALTLTGAYDDEKGFKTDKFDSYYNTELDLNATYFKGIETKDAAFVDLHDEDVYGGSILSLEDMYNAADDGYTVNLAVYLNKGAKLIVVTGVVEPHVHAGLVWTPTALKAANCHETGNPAYWTAGSCTGTGACPLDGKHYDANGTATGSNGNEIADANLTTQIDSSNHDDWGAWGTCSDATHDGHDASGCWVRTCSGCSAKEYTTTDPT